MHLCKKLAQTFFAWAIPFKELTENLFLRDCIDETVYAKWLSLSASGKTGPP